MTKGCFILLMTTNGKYETMKIQDKKMKIMKHCKVKITLQNMKKKIWIEVSYVHQSYIYLI